MADNIELKKHPETGELVPEEWEAIDGYNGFYEVSNYGRIRSWKRHALQKGMSNNPKIKKAPLDKDGYPRVGLCKNGGQISYRVNRLVAENFVPNPEDKPEVNHIDGNKINDFYLNLEWATRSENMIHAFEEGLKTTQKGESSNFSKLSKKEVLEIRNIYQASDCYYKDLASEYGVSYQTISRIINRKTWTHI